MLKGDASFVPKTPWLMYKTHQSGEIARDGFPGLYTPFLPIPDDAVKFKIAPRSKL